MGMMVNHDRLIKNLGELKIPVDKQDGVTDRILFKF